MVSNPVKARGQVSLVKLYDGTNGKDGKDGAQGVPGAPGADGKTTYVHVAYADSADGKTNFSTTDPTDRKYIGVLTDFSINDSTDYKLYTWSLAQGPVGPTGSTGATGPKGEDGLTTYVHVAYANSADGKTNFSTTDPVEKSYIGVLTDTTPADSTDYTKYTWSLVKGSDGAQGPQGVQGPKGTDGKTTYVHFAYANSADGSKDFSTTDTTGRKYIGVFTDTNINDSTNYADYTWSLVQGPTGPTGNTGAVGPKGADGRTTYVHVAYADSVDGLSNFSTTDPTGRKYIGVLTDFNMNDSTTPGDYTWSLAQGPAGPTGSTGATGAKGADGRTTYVHVAYANSADGATSFSTTDPTNRAYIGVLTDFNINDSTNYADYTWSLAKGADGAQGPQGVQGIAGAKGEDGKTTYVHVAYANSANGSVNFSTTDPTNRAYIGVLTDFNINDSVNYADYTWSLAKGADGSQGPQGPQGLTGAKGIDGKTTYIHVAYANSANGDANFSTTDPAGRAYIGVLTDFNINDSTNYSDYTWSLAKGADGANGAQGVQGPKGADGRTTYVHFAYANSADGKDGFSVSDPVGKAYMGTYTDFTLNDSTNYLDYTWSLVKGADGANGAQGIQGPKGADGRTTYVHFAYANSADGTNNFSVSDPTGRAYIGTYTDFTINDSTTPSAYTWSLIKGADGSNGAQGIQGPKGADGRTTYVHFAYANSADGTNNFSVSDPTGRTYIGTYTDFTINDSTTPSAYTWSLIKGADGAQGAQGIQGPKGADGRNTYVHFAYAGNATGTTNFSTTDPTGRAYIGVLTDFNLNDSTTPSDYTWSLAQGPTGPTGANGATGPKGADGKTTYVHIAYASNATGTSNFSTTDPTGRTYIGVLTDTNLPDSTNPADYSWSLIKGADGAQGPQGIQGPVGANGKNTYVHFAYANSADGATSFSTTDPTNRAYIGVLTDFNINDSTNYADYTWSLAKGADGAQGIQGPVGPDGRTSYVHFAYATSADGSTGFSTTDPTGASYIGTYTDFTINDSTNYKSYTWSRMKGDTGNGIANTVIEYQITNTQDQPSDTSGWTTTIPNIGAGVYLWTRTTFVYTDGTKSRTYTVSRQSDNVYTAVLTNDSITLPADASGNVTDFSGSNGQFLVYDGAYQVDPTKVTIQVAQQVNVTVATGGSNYSITAMDKTKDSGYFDLSYTYKGVLLTKRVSVSKSKRGTDGSNPVIVNLSATSQVFTFDSNNKPYPTNQNINFSTTVSGTSATPVYTAIPYTDTGTAGTAIVLGAYGTNGKQLQVAQIGNYQRVVVTVTAGGGTDSTTIVRVKDGSSVSPIPDPSNTVSSATPPTNPKEGDWWNDTSQTPNVLKYRYRDKWVQYELDGYYVKANSISGEAIVTNTLEAQKIKYTNSDGTTTNLQTFDLKGMQTVMTDSSGHTYTSMDNAVSSTQTWQGLNTKVNSLGQINQVVNSEFAPDFSGWMTERDFSLGTLNPITPYLSLDQYSYNQSNIVRVDTRSLNFTPIINQPVKITPQSGAISFSAYISTISGYSGKVSARIRFYDANKAYISASSGSTATSNTSMTYVSDTVYTIPTGAVYVAFVIGFDNKDGSVRVSKPMMVFGSAVGAYAPGNYNNNQSVAQIKAQADKLELSVSNMAVGGRNILLNTKVLWVLYNTLGSSQTQIVPEAFDSATNMWHITAPQGSGNAGVFFDQSSVSSSALTQGQSWAMSFDIKGTGVFSKFGMNSSDKWVNPMGNVPTNWSRVSSTGVTGAPGGNGVGTNLNIYFDTTNSPLDIYIKLPKLETGTFATDYTEAPEDVSAWTQSQIKLTAEQINIGVNGTKKIVDRIQSGGTNLLAMANTTRGWLDGSYNITSPGDNSLASDFIPVTPGLSYVAQQWFDAPHTDGYGYIRYAFYDANKKPMSRFPVPATGSSYSKWSITAPAGVSYIRFSLDSFYGGMSHAKFEVGDIPTPWTPAPQDLTGLQTYVNSLGQGNLVTNSEFSPDLAGWYIRGTNSLLATPTVSFSGVGKSNAVVLDTTNGTGTGNVNYTSAMYPVQPDSTLSVTVQVSSSVTGVSPLIGFIYYDANKNAIAGMRGNISIPVADTYSLYTYTGSPMPSTARYVSFDFLIPAANKAKYMISQPLMVYGSTPGTYVQGQYNTYDAVTVAQSTANTASSTASSAQATATTAKGTADSALSRANSLGQINQLFNTEFSPDFQGWYSGTSPQSGAFKQGLDLVKDTSWALSQSKYNGSNILYHNVGTGNNAFFGDPIPVGPGVQIMGAITAISDSGTNSTVTAAIYLRYYDANKNYISQVSVNSVLNSTWTQTTINSTTPANTAYVSYNLLTNGSTGINRYTQPMLVFDNKIGTYVQGNYNNNKYVSDVSTGLNLKLDSYTLGTTVDGKLVSGFTGNQQQVTIKGNMVTLDSDTVVGNNFILQSANIGDLTAGKIKTGSIVGNNLNINLDTGSVLFQKGRIYSQGKEVDINIDQNYIRSLGKFGSISLENGAIYLSGPVYDKPIITDGPSIDLYLSISSVLMPSLDSQPDGYIGAAFLAKDFMKIGLRDYPIAEWIPGETSNNLGTIISRQTGTAIYGKDIGVNIAGGSVLNRPNGISFKTPRIAVGFNPTKDPTSLSTNPGDDLRSGGILISADSVVLADGNGTHGSITRDGIKTNNYTRYVTAQNDTQNLPLVMGLERIGNIVMVSFNFVTYGSTIRADAIQMNGPKIPVGFRPVDNVHIQAHANNGGTTIGTITFTITPEGKVLQTSPAINGIARVMGSGFYLTYSVSPSVGTKVEGSTGNTTA